MSKTTKSNRNRKQNTAKTNEFFAPMTVEIENEQSFENDSNEQSFENDLQMMKKSDLRNFVNQLIDRINMVNGKPIFSPSNCIDYVGIMSHGCNVFSCFKCDMKNNTYYIGCTTVLCGYLKTLSIDGVQIIENGNSTDKTRPNLCLVDKNAIFNVYCKVFEFLLKNK